MSSGYSYGPNDNFRIRFVGEMEVRNGSYATVNAQDRYAVQVICHMIYQIRNDIQNSPNGILSIDGGWLHHMHIDGYGDDYSYYTRSNMTVFHIIQKGPRSFEFEFISPNQCETALGYLDEYAYQHRLRYGRAN